VIDPVTTLEEEASAIDFGTFLDRAPKASASPSGIQPLGAVLDKDGLQAASSGFTVLAYYTELKSWSEYTKPATPNFMDDQTVTWDTDKWVYTPVKYWPRIGSQWGKVSFFGFSTSTSASADGVDDGNPIIGFTTQATAASQVDLVADVVLDATGGDNAGKVKFLFDHILSRIGFTAKLAATYSNVTVTVTSLRVYYKVSEVISTGTYTFNTSGSGTPSDNLDADNWTMGTDSFAEASTFTSAGDPIYTGGASPATLTTTATDTKLSDPNAYLMLIPQELEAGDMYVELDYSVTTSSPTLTVNNKAIINLPVVDGGWKSGKAYTYNFTLSLNPVIFDTDIDVNNWVDGTQPDDIPVPPNP
jgi:hypothetical protein